MVVLSDGMVRGNPTGLTRSRPGLYLVQNGQELSPQRLDLCQMRVRADPILMKYASSERILLGILRSPVRGNPTGLTRARPELDLVQNGQELSPQWLDLCQMRMRGNPAGLTRTSSGRILLRILLGILRSPVRGNPTGLTRTCSELYLVQNRQELNPPWLDPCRMRVRGNPVGLTRVDFCWMRVRGNPVGLTRMDFCWMRVRGNPAGLTRQE